MNNTIGRTLFAILLVLLALFFGHLWIRGFNETRTLKKIISRLEADSRVAEVLVTEVRYDEGMEQLYTTIKFLEYDSLNRPLTPRYFTFLGNIIQFQALVVRFNDMRIRKADKLRGRSAYLFLKVFVLNGKNTQEYDITKAYEIPDGYRIGQKDNAFEKKIWRKFWKYALDPKEAERIDIKNAQIEAPGTMFVPGMLYTIKIEHDGGLRIDVSPLPNILKGEKIPVFD